MTLGLSLAQRHGLYSAAESLLVGVAPFVVTTATAITQHAQSCLPGAIVTPGVTCAANPAVYLGEYVVLTAGIRGILGWLAAQHARVVVASGVTPSTPTVTTIEQVAVVRPVAPVGPPVAPQVTVESKAALDARLAAAEAKIADMKGKANAPGGLIHSDTMSGPMSFAEAPAKFIVP